VPGGPRGGEALGYWAKTDIFGQFEREALTFFVQSLRLGMKLFEDWDGVEPYAASAGRLFAEFFPDEEHRKRYVALVVAAEGNALRAEEVTLEELGIMKTVCDFYYLRALLKRLPKEPPLEKAGDSSDAGPRAS